MISMNCLDASGHADQFRQLLAVNLVVTAQDMVNQLRRRASVGLNLHGNQAFDFAQDRVGIQSFLCAGLSQRLLSTATKVEFETTKYSCGTRNLNGQLSQTLSSVHEQVL